MTEKHKRVGKGRENLAKEEAMTIADNREHKRWPQSDDRKRRGTPPHRNSELDAVRSNVDATDGDTQNRQNKVERPENSPLMTSPLPRWKVNCGTRRQR